MIRSFSFSIYVYILWCFMKFLSVWGKSKQSRERKKIDENIILFFCLLFGFFNNRFFRVCWIRDDF